MPSHEEHCNDSFRRYGYNFSEVHRWMDEPCRIAGSSHRQFRHNPYETPKEAEQIFSNIVPEQFKSIVKHVILDHIKLDRAYTETKTEIKIQRDVLLDELKILSLKVKDSFDIKNEGIYQGALKQLSFSVNQLENFIENNEEKIDANIYEIDLKILKTFRLFIEIEWDFQIKRGEIKKQQDMAKEGENISAGCIENIYKLGVSGKYQEILLDYFRFLLHIFKSIYFSRLGDYQKDSSEFGYALDTKNHLGQMNLGKDYYNKPEWNLWSNLWDLANFMYNLAMEENTSQNQENN